MSEALIQSILAQAESKIEHHTGMQVRVTYIELTSHPTNPEQNIFLRCLKLLETTESYVQSKKKSGDRVGMRQAIALALKTIFPRLTMVQLMGYLNYRDHTSAIHSLMKAREFLKNRDEVFMKYYSPLIPLIDEFKINPS